MSLFQGKSIDDDVCDVLLEPKTKKEGKNVDFDDENVQKSPARQQSPIKSETFAIDRKDDCQQVKKFNLDLVRTELEHEDDLNSKLTSLTEAIKQHDEEQDDEEECKEQESLPVQVEEEEDEEEEPFSEVVEDEEAQLLKLKEKLRERGWDDISDEEPERKLKQIKSPVKQDRRKEIEKEQEAESTSSFDDQNVGSIQLRKVSIEEDPVEGQKDEDTEAKDMKEDEYTHDVEDVTDWY